MDTSDVEQVDQGIGIGGIIGMLFSLAFIILIVASVWKVFSKAGEPGWAAIVPIYNVIVFLKIAGKPLWWIVLLFIPVANLVVGILAALGISKNFGKGDGFGIGLAFLPFIFYPILGFGSATFVGQKTA